MADRMAFETKLRALHEQERRWREDRNRANRDRRSLIVNEYMDQQKAVIGARMAGNISAPTADIALAALRNVRELTEHVDDQDHQLINILDLVAEILGEPEEGTE